MLRVQELIVQRDIAVSGKKIASFSKNNIALSLFSNFGSMYVYLLCHNYKKVKQVQSLKNSKSANKVTVVNKQASKLCIASQVNQTTDRDDKAHGAIALQLVRAPGLN